jgi:acyl-CoA synthetase (AMP-forming)/AMP-acid ligase II
MSRDHVVKPPHESVRSILEHHAGVTGDSPYLISARDERDLTYAALVARVDSWRRVLRSFGVREGARIGIVIADPLDFATALLAVLCDGSWAAPLDPALELENRELFTRRTSQLHLDAVLSDRTAPTSGVPWIVISDVLDAATPNEVASSTSGGIILSSSGTTGTPKVIALSEHQLIYTATGIARHNQLSSEDRGFNPLPLWHINAEVVGLLATLVAGCALVLDDRFHRTDFWGRVEHFEVTWINAVPAIISRIAEVKDGESVPPRLRFVRSASAPLAPALMASFQANTGVAVVESYGMTEAASQICVNPLDGPRKIGSVGPPVGVELRIAPLADTDVLDETARAHVGHVEIRGPSVITHYDATGYEDRFDAEGWLKTGDLGYLDGDGYLFLVGRSDDVINRGGEKIFPREIEDVVLASPHVVAAAAVGVADEVFGQVPVLYVQFAPTMLSNLDEVVHELAHELQAKLSSAQRPRRLVVVESLPTHATGKVQKTSLARLSLLVLLELDLA